MSYKQNPGRRHSLLEVSQSPRWRSRSASLSVMEVTDFPGSSGGGVTRRASACTTPCFVSPSLAFTTQFSYDSPIQILTSSGMLNPRVVSSKLRRRCTLRSLPHCCKMILILLFFAISCGLFIHRTINEKRSASVLSLNNDCQEDDPHCEDFDDDLVHDHPSLKRFMRAVKQPTHYHVLTSDLDDSVVRTLEDEEQQQQQQLLLSQMLESEGSGEVGNRQEATLEDLPTEELLEQLDRENQEPSHNHWLPEHQEHTHKMQRLTIQGQYREDLQQHEAVQAQQYTTQDYGLQSQYYMQGQAIPQIQQYSKEANSPVQQYSMEANSPVQQYSVEANSPVQQYSMEANSPVQQYSMEANSPVQQYSMQEYASMQPNTIQEHVPAQQQYQREYPHEPIMQGHWPEGRAVQGELVNPVYQYPEYASLEQQQQQQQILQSLEHVQQQRGLGQEWVAPEQGNKQTGEHLQQEPVPGQRQVPSGVYHDQPRPAKLLQQRSSGQPGEALPGRPQEKPHQTSRKLKQGPLKPRPREGGVREHRAMGRGMGSKSQGQRLPPGVNPRRYRLSEL